jgi:iron(III) transport system substrate-binding protein
MTKSPRTWSRRAGIGGAGLLAVVVAGCGGGDGGETLRVYSGRHYDVEQAFAQFSDETGINVEFLTGNDAELRERIAAEGEDTEADVYLTVDAGNLAAAAEEGLFQPLDSPVLDEAIPAEYRDPQDRWFGLALRTRTIVYNPELISEDEVPKTYEELADPKWDGRLCLRNANNSYQQSLVASMIAADGEDETLEVLEGWADNAEIYGNDVELLEAMAAGACEVGVSNHYYLAQQFLEWLATDGQSVLVDANHEYPANPAATPEPLITEQFGTDFLRDPLDAATFGALNPDAIRLMDEAGYD